MERHLVVSYLPSERTGCGEKLGLWCEIDLAAKCDLRQITKTFRASLSHSHENRDQNTHPVRLL